MQVAKGAPREHGRSSGLPPEVITAQNFPSAFTRARTRDTGKQHSPSSAQPKPRSQGRPSLRDTRGVARPEPVVPLRDGNEGLAQAVGVSVTNPWADKEKGGFSKGNWRC